MRGIFTKCLRPLVRSGGPRLVILYGLLCGQKRTVNLCARKPAGLVPILGPRPQPSKKNSLGRLHFLDARQAQATVARRHGLLPTLPIRPWCFAAGAIGAGEEAKFRRRQLDFPNAALGLGSG